MTPAVGVAGTGGEGLPLAASVEAVAMEVSGEEPGGEGLSLPVEASLAGMSVEEVRVPFATARAMFEKRPGEPAAPAGAPGPSAGPSRPVAAIVKGKIWEARRAAYGVAAAT